METNHGGRILRSRRAIFRIALPLLLIAAFPLIAAAYVGPGAGFAVLSSFFALFLGFLYSLLALVTWPFRQLRRLLRSRTALGKAKVRRLVILGLDGLDPKLAARYMDAGKLPNLARLRDDGTFCPLQTTTPPISPVAWSSFQTGVNPGKHNIFDFLARDPVNYLPYLSSAQIGAPHRQLRFGRFAIPLGRSRVKLLRKASPFWNYLGKSGIFCSVLRVPITFPPERFPGVLLSGMCVPDLRGTQGTFTAYSSAVRDAGRSDDKGTRLPLTGEGNRFSSYIPGPDKARVEFRLRIANGACELEISGQKFRLVRREYSEWIELKFRMAPGVTAHGICRFYLKELAPDIELYVTPINIHPGKPALPISHPYTYSIYLSKLLAPYATLGLAEDSWALNEGVLDDEGFLRQCYMNHEERERMFFDALQKTRSGVCVCVFDTPDRIQHMFWRHFPRNGDGDGGAANSAGNAIEQMYDRMDDLVGRTLARIDDGTLLFVVSDHGFNSFARGVNLNTWLWENGYLALKEGCRQSGDWFKDVDWKRTRAYAMGLAGLYINQKGRERLGVVEPGSATAQLKQELREKLDGIVDAATGRQAIVELIESAKAYSGPYRENAPDFIVGYAEGYRAGWDSATGRVGAPVFDDNTRAWSGDHCIHSRLVPGVLFSNRKIGCQTPSIIDIAATALDLFGLPVPSHFDGRPWTLRS